MTENTGITEKDKFWWLQDFPFADQGDVCRDIRLEKSELNYSMTSDQEGMREEEN